MCGVCVCGVQGGVSVCVCVCVCEDVEGFQKEGRTREEG